MKLIPVLLVVAACAANHQVQCDQAFWDQTKAEVDLLVTVVSFLYKNAEAALKEDQNNYTISSVAQDVNAESQANSLMDPIVDQLDDLIAEAAELQVNISDCLGEAEEELRLLANSTITDMQICRRYLVKSTDILFDNWFSDLNLYNATVYILSVNMDSCDVNNDDCISIVAALVLSESLLIPKGIEETESMANLIWQRNLSSQNKICTVSPINGLKSRSSELFDQISECIENKIHN